MTREEAIKILKEIDIPTNGDNEKERNMAFNMAIKALEQEPTTRNCFGCKYSKDNHNAGTEECHLCMWENQYTPTTKNDLGVDCIDRKATLDTIIKRLGIKNESYLLPAERTIYQQIKEMPSVTPQEPKWIPVKFRPLTDEEQDEYPDYCYMADCPMPDDGEEILVCTAHGGVEKDECGFEDGFYLDSGYDWQTDIVAWMPLPTPYEPQESEDKE